MGYRVAVVGATGAVGREMLNILSERKFPATEVIPLASAKSQGQEISFGDKRLKVQNLANFDFKGVDFALMSAGSSVAREYGEKIGATGCIVVDMRMPGGSGLDLQSQLLALGSKLPLIFLTAHADVPTSVRAMKAGATDFITKPFINQVLLDAVDHAIRLDDERRKSDEELKRVQTLADSLTPREQEVMHAVASGLMNKQVAYQLGISEMTVKLHRMSVMRKMQSRSLADLVRKVEKLQKS